MIQKARVQSQTTLSDTSGPPGVFQGCPLEGVATGVHRQESNREKNRITHPQAADIDSSVSLPAIMQPGYDADRWSEARGASIVG